MLRATFRYSTYVGSLSLSSESYVQGYNSAVRAAKGFFFFKKRHVHNFSLMLDVN